MRRPSGVVSVVIHVCLALILLPNIDGMLYLGFLFWLTSDFNYQDKGATLALRYPVIHLSGARASGVPLGG